MVIAEVSTVITGIKGTIDIVKGLKSSYDDHAIVQAQTQIREQLLTILSDAIALQEKHSALINEKDELKKKLMEYEQWENTVSEYELKEVVPGKFVYTYKKSQQSTTPMHWLCPNCWNDRKKSILQVIHRTEREASHKCPRCDFGILVYFSQLL